MSIKSKLHNIATRHLANKLCGQINMAVLSLNYPKDIKHYQRAIKKLNDFDASNRGKHAPLKDCVANDPQFKIKGNQNMQTVNMLCSMLTLFRLRYGIVMGFDDYAMFATLYNDIKLFDPDSPMTLCIRNCKVAILRQIEKASSDANAGMLN